MGVKELRVLQGSIAVEIEVYYAKNFKPASTLVLNPITYTKLVSQLRSINRYLPTNPDDTFTYNGLRVVRSYDVEEFEFMVLGK